MKEEENGMFKYFFEISPDLMCIAGFDGYFKRINPAVSKLLGYSEAELLAMPINHFIYKDDKNITATVRGELRKNSPLQNFENRYVTKDGELVWLAWTSIPNSNHQLIYAIAKNITHKKALEQERNSLLIEFTRINKELKRLSYTNSHDLRSPVNNLISIFNLLDVSKITDAETLQFLKMLETSSENLKDTLNENLDLLVQHDASDIKIERINLNTSLNAVLLSINSLIDDSSTIIESDFSLSEEVHFNRAFMDSLFLNLITNSIKYAQPGLTPVISITSRIIDGKNQLIFKDNGLGFDMELVKDKIFCLHEKFHNHMDSRGIGLYLVHNHITSLGGQISVESKVNEGAEFVISFKK